MRGAGAPAGVIFLRYFIWQLEDVDPAAVGGYSVDFGTPSLPGHFGTVLFFLPGSPSAVHSGETDHFHIGPWEPFQMTITGAPLTAGSLELSLEMLRF